MYACPEGGGGGPVGGAAGVEGGIERADVAIDGIEERELVLDEFDLRGADGEGFKAFHVLDGHGIKLLRAAGVRLLHLRMPWPLDTGTAFSCTFS